MSPYKNNCVGVVTEENVFSIYVKVGDLCGFNDKNSHYIHFSMSNDLIDDELKIMGESIRPTLYIHEKDLNDKNFKYKISDDKIRFSELVWPTKYCPEIEKEFQENSKLFKPTFRSYVSSIRTIPGLDIKSGEEFVYKGERYVRLYVDRRLKNPHIDWTKYSDDSPIKQKTFAWFKVEPIEFKMRSFAADNKYFDYGDDNKMIELTAANGIIANLSPFSIDKLQKDDKEFPYKNSAVRAYLNGTAKEKIKTDFLQEAFLAGGMDLQKYQEEKKKVASLSPKVIEFSKPKNFQTRAANPYAVTVDERPMSVDEQIEFYINNKKSFMLHGESGVGKSRRIKEVDPQCVFLALHNGMLPEEVVGKTIFESGTEFWVEPGWYRQIKKVCESDPEHNHVLFIDEITNVREEEQGLVFSLVLDRSIDGNRGKLPDNCVVVAAGNNKNESESAHNMPEPLFRRFEGHIYLKPEIQSFIEWGSKLDENGRPKIHPLVSAFVATFGKKVFYSDYDSEEPPKYAIDPRGWEQISNIIYDNKGVLREKLIEDKAGSSIAKSLIAFAKTTLISVEDIVEETYKLSDIPQTADKKYALVCSLLRANENQVKKVREFIYRYLGGECLATFDSIWISNDDERALLIGQLNKEASASKNENEKF